MSFFLFLWFGCPLSRVRIFLLFSVHSFKKLSPMQFLILLVCLSVGLVLGMPGAFEFSLMSAS